MQTIKRVPEPRNKRYKCCGEDFVGCRRKVPEGSFLTLQQSHSKDRCSAQLTEQMGSKLAAVLVRKSLNTGKRLKQICGEVQLG